MKRRRRQAVSRPVRARVNTPLATVGNVSPVVRRRPGRPSEFNEAIGAAICKRVAEGKSLKSISRSPGMPSMMTILRWLNTYTAFSEAYERARDARAEMIFEETLEIADDSSRDYTETGDGRRVVDHEHVNRARLRTDVRKWFLAKLHPKRFADQVGQQSTNVTVSMNVLGIASLVQRKLESLADRLEQPPVEDKARG